MDTGAERDETATIEWNALSPNTVRIGGRLLDLPKRVRHVLQRLIVEPNVALTVDQLADALWADDELPKSIRNSLARFISDLRRHLGPHGDRIETANGCYRVRVEPGECDLDITRTAVTDVEATLATNPDPDDPTLRSTTGTLRRVVERIGVGPARHLADLRGLDAIARSHDELRVGAIETLATALHRQQRHHDAVALLELAVAEHPYYEPFWQVLFAVLDESKRDHDATEARARHRDVLRELGVPPSPSANAAQEPTKRTAGPELTSPEPANPELEHGVMVGRVDDLRSLRGQSERHRLVTIVGLGGSGKTRLATALGELLAETGQVHRLDLRTVEDPRVVAPLAATALGMPPGSGLGAHDIANRVDTLDLTLIIDNCEHLIEPVVELTAALLETAPNTRIVATSRQALGTPDEHLYLLAPLGVAPPPPASGDGGPTRPATSPSPAAELFLERAGSRIDAPTPDQTVQIETLCSDLNGLPLAIELAAAQLSIMTLDQLARRTALAAEHATPSSGITDVNEPAVTAVANALDWAWDNLTPSQQALLSRLSVFASGWTEAAARSIRAGTESLTADLERLVALALVDGHPSANDETPLRYSMLVPVREYAAARLDERAETGVVLNRLVDWAIDLTGQWSFPEHHLWSEPNDTLQPEHGNLLTALNHLEANGRITELVRLASAASGMMVNSGFSSDLIRWLSPHLDNDTIPSETRGEAATALGAARHAVGDLEGLAELGTIGIELADGRPLDWLPILVGYYSVWSLVAPVEYATDDLSAMAFDIAERSASRELNLGVAALYRAHVEFVSRNYDAALRLFTEARDLVVKPGRGLMVIEIGITMSLYMLGRHDDARTSIADWRSRSDTDHWHYIVEVVRAIIMGGTGDPDAATRELGASVRALPEAGAWGRAGIIQTAYAILADHRGEPELATELFASAVNRDILLLSVAIAHVMGTRGVTGDDAWLEVGIEFWTRVVPPESVVATATSTPQLLNWWSTGDGREL